LVFCPPIGGQTFRQEDAFVAKQSPDLARSTLFDRVSLKVFSVENILREKSFLFSLSCQGEGAERSEAGEVTFPQNSKPSFGL
jgi:hypothetical protein